MSRPATSRLKYNAPLGRMPVLQFMQPAELQIDASYQRDLATGPSQTLIRKIAQFWNWDLCQPLVVARRAGGELFVIDGQHRLEAARLRGDIPQLPCVVVEYASAADEAASFVHLNQQRRPLSKLDLFKAAVASEDPEACAILEAMTEAGLSVAPHSNYTAWKPGMVQNIGGIEKAWRSAGPKVTAKALVALRLGFQGQVLRYAGTIFPGIVAVCSDEVRNDFRGERFERFCRRLGHWRQEEWRTAIMRQKGEEPELKYNVCSAHVLRREWRKEQGAEAPAELKFTACRDGKAWCDQCDMAVTEAQAASCKSRYCSLRKAA
jgi:hypothetical protein